METEILRGMGQYGPVDSGHAQNAHATILTKTPTAIFFLNRVQSVEASGELTADPLRPQAPARSLGGTSRWQWRWPPQGRGGAGRSELGQRAF